ncbi:uncharacterized protein LOC135484075 isoform X2 [Lineus longissimus]|uniref:uncharacterized protein LOC135484075 isoform X2 n=1 Tax=Lineus longissimus TaxID=88925 RepID=UPI00315CDB5B
MATEKLRIGVDVGGTNTDAAVLCGNSLVGWAKVLTTPDVTLGVADAIKSALKATKPAYKDKEILQVSIGTTHFVNAVIQRKNLVPVAILRLCGPASHSLPPLCEFPDDLAKIVSGLDVLVQGGYQFDGQPIVDVDKNEIIDCAKRIEDAGLKNVVVSGIFSPVSTGQEEQVAQILLDQLPDISITISHRIGHIGLLERENAAILNECLKPLCKETILGFQKALSQDVGLDCPFYLTQNDGTLISSDDCIEYPVRTFASGPTNSMRGAAFLSGRKNAIVIDIGGTTTDVGVLSNGFPREASTKVQVGGVNTNFRMPDVMSIGLGGGSLVRERDVRSMRETMCLATKMKVGPESVGYNLCRDAVVFGGNKLTATDIAVRVGLANGIGEERRLQNIPRMIADSAMAEIHSMVEKAIDQAKLTCQDQPVILVGGGSILVDEKKPLQGASEVIKPPYFQVANAVGAALSQIGHMVDLIVSYAKTPRDEVIENAKKTARQAVINGGADPSTVNIVEVIETPLAYLLGDVTRLQIKAVGDLFPDTQLADDIAVVCLSPKVQVVRLFDDEDETDSAVPSDFDFGLINSPVLPKQTFDIDEKTGEWILHERDVECISIGAGILGCGGGGSPHIARLRALNLLKQGKKIRVISPDRLGTCPELDGYVTLVAFMGAPTVILEKLMCGKDTMASFKMMEKLLQSDFNDPSLNTIEADGIRAITDAREFSKLKKVNNKKLVAVMCAEIGGLNAIEPLAVAAELGIPVVDCDGMGRAFPELQMFVPFIYGVPSHPGVICDEKGNAVVTTRVDSGKHLENFFREQVAKMGCVISLSMSLLSPDDVKKYSILHSYSRAWQIGDAVLRAREMKLSPTAVILKSVQGNRLIHGKIADIDRMTADGFTKGRLIVEGLGRFQNTTLFIDFQNENLVARQRVEGDDEMEVVACVPDLISILDSDTGQPITTEEIRYGLRVVVIAMASSPRLRTEEALKVVGPKYFGYDDVTFEPLCEYAEFRTIPPS